MSIKYGFGKEFQGTFDGIVERVIEALKQEGFGVLTEIDVAATLEKKLNRKMPPYRILGACNPSLAHQAITAEPSIGLLLPCNVVVRTAPDNSIHVEFMDPNAVLDLVGKPEISSLAATVKLKLEHVLQSI
jgi:uncharacterized protein (DUF302 family)